MKTRRTAEFRTDNDEQLRAVDVQVLLAEVPPEAKISAIRVDKGSQREPWPVLVGLRAEWEES